MKKASEYYKHYGVNVSTEFTHDSEHCQPTLDYGNSCTTLASPYISKCNYDGAGAAFKALLGTVQPRGTYVQSNLIKFSQKKYMPSGSGFFGVPGLADTAYVYVPSSCRNGTKCGIHTAFHGCNQDISAVGTKYVEHAGYLEWAETNNQIVLFPQAAKSYLHSNPQACFDWWGYVDANYAFKTSKQLQTVRNMVAALKTAGGI